MHISLKKAEIDVNILTPSTIPIYKFLRTYGDVIEKCPTYQLSKLRFTNHIIRSVRYTMLTTHPYRHSKAAPVW